MTRKEALRNLLIEMNVEDIDGWMAEADNNGYDGRLLEICSLFKSIDDSMVSLRPDWFERIKSTIDYRGPRDDIDRAYLKLHEQNVDTDALRTVMREMQMRVAWKLISGVHDGAGSPPVKAFPNRWIGFCTGTYDENVNPNDDVEVLSKSLHPIIDDFIKST